MPDVRLDAVPDGAGVRLTGVKPWCSLGGLLDAALVTAHTPDGRQLFRVDLRQDEVTPEPAERWLARGLRTVTSAPVHFDGARAEPVGPPGWYLRRPGFAWGGMGVAACWYGGSAWPRSRPSPLAPRARTATSTRCTSARSTRRSMRAEATLAARRAARSTTGARRATRAPTLALRVRAVVADAAERTLRHAAHALGPTPLAFDADHAARVADLELYVRQHHAERDLAALGRARTERHTVTDDVPAHRRGHPRVGLGRRAAATRCLRWSRATRRLIVLAAHPDDESLGAAGLIAASARLGARITVVVATDGEASHPRSSTHTRRTPSRPCVARSCAPPSPRSHRTPTCAISACRTGSSTATAPPWTQSLPSSRRTRSERVRIVTPWSGDRHPDHAACAAAGERFAAGRDAEHWQFPIWLWHWGDSADLPRARLRRLDLSPQDVAAKQAALDEHVSQHRPLSDLPGDEAVLAPGMVEHFRRPFECFVVASRAGLARRVLRGSLCAVAPIRGGWPTGSTNGASGRC